MTWNDVEKISFGTDSILAFEQSTIFVIALVLQSSHDFISAENENTSQISQESTSYIGQ